MTTWHCYKYTNDAWVEHKWQIYYVQHDGRKRYYGESLDYPTAAAMVEALADPDIRRYAVEHMALDIRDAYAHTQANMAIFERIKGIARAHGSDTLSIAMMADAIKAEEG